MAVQRKLELLHLELNRIRDSFLVFIWTEGFLFYTCVKLQVVRITNYCAATGSQLGAEDGIQGVCDSAHGDLGLPHTQVLEGKRGEG